ncbi:MAG: peptidylprolyl isomerase [Treponema sp.]|nr:peptidylprolyl isomerase [Treponema sp.]
MKIKQLAAGIFFALVIITNGGCNVLDGKEGIFAIMDTDKGEIVLELYYKDTPLTVTNFVGLAEGTLDATGGKPFYNGLKFHRVISKANHNEQDFMIQGGDPRGNGTGGPGYQFADEIVQKYTFSQPGVLAMANAGPGTNGSQFFITIVPTPWLNGNHTIFGKVISGQNVVNVMRTNDVIKSVTIVRQGKDAEQFTATQADFDRLKDAQFTEQLAEIAQRFPGYEKTANGIFYKTTKPGNGTKTGLGKQVATHYKGYFINGTVFDASEEGKPLSFTTGAGQMIPGFDQMVQDMQRGEKRTVILPPEMAYGTRGVPGVIPGNTYLVFDIELISN